MQRDKWHLSWSLKVSDCLALSDHLLKVVIPLQFPSPLQASLNDGNLYVLSKHFCTQWCIITTTDAQCDQIGSNQIRLQARCSKSNTLRGRSSIHVVVIVKNRCCTKTLAQQARVVVRTRQILHTDDWPILVICNSFLCISEHSVVLEGALASDQD